MFFSSPFVVYSPWELDHGDAAGTLQRCGDLIACILSPPLPNNPFFFPTALFSWRQVLAMVVGLDQVLVGVKEEHGVS